MFHGEIHGKVHGFRLRFSQTNHSFCYWIFLFWPSWMCLDVSSIHCFPKELTNFTNTKIQMGMGQNWSIQLYPIVRIAYFEPSPYLWRFFVPMSHMSHMSSGPQSPSALGHLDPGRLWPRKVLAPTTRFCFEGVPINGGTTKMDGL